MSNNNFAWRQPRLPFPNWDTVEFESMSVLNTVKNQHRLQQTSYGLEMGARWLLKAVTGGYRPQLAQAGNSFYQLKVTTLRSSIRWMFQRTGDNGRPEVAFVYTEYGDDAAAKLRSLLREKPLNWKESKYY